MKLKLVLVFLCISLSTYAQKNISLNTQISIQLPNEAELFDDVKYKEMMKPFGDGAVFELLTKNVYKINDNVIRMNVINGQVNLIRKQH